MVKIRELVNSCEHRRTCRGSGYNHNCHSQRNGEDESKCSFCQFRNILLLFRQNIIITPCLLLLMIYSNQMRTMLTCTNQMAQGNYELLIRQVHTFCGCTISQCSVKLLPKTYRMLLDNTAPEALKGLLR